jgi:hypothetical protein
MEMETNPDIRDTRWLHSIGIRWIREREGEELNRHKDGIETRMYCSDLEIVM